MKIGLFIPCYIDMFYPDVELATVELLEQAGCTVEYPDSQTCCGQPMANTGGWEDARGVAPVAALDYRGDAAERGSDLVRLITASLLCQDTPVDL